MGGGTLLTVRGSGFVNDIGGAGCVFVGADLDLEGASAGATSVVSTTTIAAVIATVVSREEVQCVSPERSQLSTGPAVGGANQTAYSGQAVSVEVTVVRPRLVKHRAITHATQTRDSLSQQPPAWPLYDRYMTVIDA